MIADNAKKGTFFIYTFLSIFGMGFIFFILSMQYINHKENELQNKIYPNVFMDGKNIGGKTKTEVTQKYEALNEKLANINVQVLYKKESIATFSAKTLNVHSNGKEMVDRAYTVGRTPHTPSRFYQKLTTILGLSKYEFSSKITYDKNSLSEFVNETEEQYNRPAKNALFKFENARVVNFREDEKGVKLKSDKLYADLDTQINQLSKNIKTITIDYQDAPIEPETSLSKTNDFGIEELIGEGQSNYSHSSPERIHNLTLAASKFNGVLIPKDKVFSFNETIGDISSLTGYKPGYIIIGGKTVLGDGGGVCQVSTTLFRTALYTGLPIVDRLAHAYRVIYYENDSKPGLDATVFSPSVDFKFKNDTQAAILIQIEQDTENNLLKFKFYGKKDDRKITLSPIQVYDVQPPPPARNQDDPTLKKGVTKQVEFPSWGAKSVFDYKVTLGDKTLFEKKFYSNYRPWSAVYLVGTAD